MHLLKQWLGIEISAVSSREKLISLLGGVVSIFVLVLATGRCLHLQGAAAIIASMGASAVLLFAVPHGPLSQPWPVFAGHVFSAIVGVSCASWIPYLPLAAALAVGISIGLMHQFKCIHPPGGATALTAVLGGPAVHALGFRYVICPVLVNSLLMIAIGVAFNACFGWRRYPAFWGRRSVTEAPGAPSHEEIVAAMRKLDTFMDVTEEDLVLLSRVLSNRSMKIEPRMEL